MKQYEKIDSSTIRFANTCFPVSPGNLEYEEMLVEIAAGTAELLPIPQKKTHWVDARQAPIANSGYGTVNEQLNMMYDDLINGTTTWVDNQTAVKAAHPKD